VYDAPLVGPKIVSEQRKSGELSAAGFGRYNKIYVPRREGINYSRDTCM
jgi:hypothetical protein